MPSWFDSKLKEFPWEGEKKLPKKHTQKAKQESFNTKE